MMKTAIGLMSGTSMDGIDVALVRTDGEDQLEFGPSLAIDYSAEIRLKIERELEAAKSIEKRGDRPGGLAALEQDITNLHADAVDKFLQENGLTPSDIDVIGFHGQTVLHRPEIGLTVQLGLGNELAKATGIDVVYDMRAADMVAGGQGAPLVPIFHKAIAAGLDREMPICIVNIGGISNISYIDEVNLVAFDSGPGNALIDQWVQAKSEFSFDEGGKIAAQGQVLDGLVERYMASEYFSKPVPKSLDRNDFSPLEASECSLEDGARTLAHISAQSILRAQDHLPNDPKTWIICGGGRLNNAIMNDLADLAGDTATVIPAEDVDLAGDMVEAQAFAYLAVRSLRGLPLTFPSTTGCKQPVTGGVLAKS